MPDIPGTILSHSPRNARDPPSTVPSHSPRNVRDPRYIPVPQSAESPLGRARCRGPGRAAGWTLQFPRLKLRPDSCPGEEAVRTESAVLLVQCSKNSQPSKYSGRRAGIHILKSYFKIYLFSRLNKLSIICLFFPIHWLMKGIPHPTPPKKY